MSISTTRITRLTIVSAAVLLAVAASDARVARTAQIEPSPPIDTHGAASILSGPQRIAPAAGTAGVTNAFAFRPSNLPGEYSTTQRAGSSRAMPGPEFEQGDVPSTLATVGSAASVTVLQLALVDPSRPTSETPDVSASSSRALPTTVYLPPGAAADPLVLLAHGAGGSPEKFTALATYWAERGYVVAVPRFPLTNDLVPEPVIGDFPQQAADARFVIDEVLESSATPGTQLTGRVDADRIGLFGLSLGSLTVWSEVLGDRPDVRIDALIQSDGITLVPQERFAEISFPVLVAHSDVDSVFPFADVVANFHRLPGEKYLLTMHGAQHATVAENTATPADALYQETTTVFWDRALSNRVGTPFPPPVDAVTSFVEAVQHLPGTR